MRTPNWAPFVSFTVDGPGAPMVLARMPTEPVRWRIVQRELGRVAMSYGARATGIFALDGCGEGHWFAAFVRAAHGSGKPWLPEFELWHWRAGAFHKVRPK